MWIWTILLLILPAFSQEDPSAYQIERMRCDELHLGESFRMNNSGLSSQTRVQQKYTLVRESADSFTAYLNLKFVSPTDTSRFRDKITLCYERFADKLKDERGRQIQLRLFDKKLHPEVAPPPEFKVTVGKNEDPTSSVAFYVPSDGCATFIHEAFHLLGLVDEYPEEWQELNPHPLKRILRPTVHKKTSSPAFDCRAPSVPESLMYNHNFINYKDRVLFSAQVDSIIYPNCMQRNQDYYACTKNAYRTSRKHGDFFGCKDAPQICKTSNWLMTQER